MGSRDRGSREGVSKERGGGLWQIKKKESPLVKIESEHAGQMNFHTEGKIKNLWSFQPLPVAEGNKATQRVFFFLVGWIFFSVCLSLTRQTQPRYFSY